jgi:hypothetical protein
VSLKGFHYFFVTVSALTALGFGVWGFFEHQRTGAPVTVVYAAGGLIGGGVLVAYGLWVARKLKSVNP